MTSRASCLNLSPSLLSLSLSLPELPSPTLASLSELKVICTKFYRSTVPTELGYSYDELKTMDDVSISLLPEKKGTVFKHNEYMVESKVQCWPTTHNKPHTHCVPYLLTFLDYFQLAPQYRQYFHHVLCTPYHHILLIDGLGPLYIHLCNAV